MLCKYSKSTLLSKTQTNKKVKSTNIYKCIEFLVAIKCSIQYLPKLKDYCVTCKF